MRPMISRLFLSRQTVFAVAIAATAFLFPSILFAGVVIKGEQTPGDGGPGTRNSIAVSDGKARMESVTNGQEITMIYRSDKDLFWLVDNSARTYREMTRTELGKMMKQVDEAIRKMKEQLASLPPEQRKAMEKMMENQLAAFGREDTAPAISYVKIGDGGEVNEWSTVKYEGRLDGKKVSEVWAAPASEVRVGLAEMKTMENMMGFFREIAGKFGADSLTVLGPDGGLDGLPVKFVMFSNGRPASIYTVTSIEQKDLPASDFEVPAGYEKLALTGPEWQ
jgi:hypothetical protein